MQQQASISFSESQRFDQPWLWLSLGAGLLLLLAVFGYGLYVQLVLGQPWGDRPLSDTDLIWLSLVSLVGYAALLLLLYLLRLSTEVRPDGLSIHFHPLRHKLIPYRRIQSVQARRYRPLWEYGGWGIRYGPGGWAYNVKGDRGVQLVLDNGSRLLLGSQRPDALERAIKQQLG